MHAIRLAARCPPRRTLLNPLVRSLATNTPIPPTPPSKAPAASEPLDKSSLPSLDFSPSSDKTDTGRTGAKSSKDSLSSIERRRRFLSRLTFGALGVGLGLYTISLGGEWTEEELKQKRMTFETAPSTRWSRTTARFNSIFDVFTKPIWNELLPPALAEPHQRPYTLLLSLDDLLVTSTWDRQYGWRTAKRPGVDYFLAYLSLFYEIVLFTSQYHYTAMPIVEKLDPYNFHIAYRLFRDATSSDNGRPVKDLSYLNRDLSKVVQLDTDPDHVTSHPENAIVMKKWKGEPGDRGLIDMIPFLESIAIYKPPDVRPILEAYRDKDIPIEYAKKEAEAKQKHFEEWKASKGLSDGGFTLSRLFGSSDPNTSPVPLTYLEQKRREAQHMYKDEQEYIAANKENFDRLLEEDRQAMAREMSGNMLSTFEALFNGGKKDSGSSAGEQRP